MPDADRQPIRPAPEGFHAAFHAPPVLYDVDSEVGREYIACMKLAPYPSWITLRGTGPAVAALLAWPQLCSQPPTRSRISGRCLGGQQGKQVAGGFARPSGRPNPTH